MIFKAAKSILNQVCLIKDVLSEDMLPGSNNLGVISPNEDHATAVLSL